MMANQIALFALVALAAIMEKGSITVFNLAFNLQSVPVAIIGVSYATAAFPALSKHFAEEEIKKFLNQVLLAAQHIIFWSLPVLVLMVVLRAQIVRTIFGSGAFDWTATMLTAACLALFAVSIAAQSLSLLFVRAFYAAERNLIPLMVNVCSSFVIVAGGYGLLKLYDGSMFFQNFMESLFRVEGVAGTEVLMLPLAYSLGMMLHAGILMYVFRKHFQYSFAPLKDMFTQGLFSALLGGFVAYEFLQVLGIKNAKQYQFLDLSTFLGISTQGLVAGIAGLITWWLILELMDNVEVRDVRRALARKFWKTRVVMPDKEEI
jgi:putative peptidoglycan lipid II flippase